MNGRQWWDVDSVKFDVQEPPKQTNLNTCARTERNNTFCYCFGSCFSFPYMSRIEREKGKRKPLIGDHSKHSTLSGPKPDTMWTLYETFWVRTIETNKERKEKEESLIVPPSLPSLPSFLLLPKH